MDLSGWLVLALAIPSAVVGILQICDWIEAQRKKSK